MKGFRFLIAVVVLLLVAGVAFGSFYTLNNAEEAVIERFGKLHSVNTQAGLHFKLPFLDHVIIYNTNEIYSLQYGYRVQSESGSGYGTTYIDNEVEETVLTKGAYLINIGAVVQYRITDPVAYHYNVSDQQRTIRLAFESVIRSNVQNQLLDEALVNKDMIAREILPDLSQKLASYNLGVSLTDVKFTDVLLPEEVQFAYDDVSIASNEKDSLRSKAEKYSNEKLPEARAEAYQMVQAAEAYKSEKIAQAKGDTENFNQVYERYVLAKEVTKARLYIETMESVLARVEKKYILDSVDDGVFKYIPIGGSN